MEDFGIFNLKDMPECCLLLVFARGFRYGIMVFGITDGTVTDQFQTP